MSDAIDSASPPRSRASRMLFGTMRRTPERGASMRAFPRRDVLILVAPAVLVVLLLYLAPLAMNGAMRVTGRIADGSGPI